MNPQKQKNRPLPKYAFYSGIAFQMLAIILLCTFAGVKLDAWIKTQIPAFTIILSLSGVILAIYQVTRDLMKKK